MMTNENKPPNPDEKIPLAERKFATRPPSQPLLVIQYVTEGGTGKTYFRFMAPPNKIEGFASNAEEAYERAQQIAKRLHLDIHDEIVHVTI